MMFRSRLFRTHFAIAALSIFGCVYVGSWILQIAVQGMDTRQMRQRPIFYANLIEEFSTKDPVAGVKKLEGFLGPSDPLQLVVLDEKGKALYPADATVPEIQVLPEKSHESVDIPSPVRNIRPILGATGSPGAGGGLPQFLIKLNFSPARYLFITRRNTGGAGSSLGPRIFQLSFLVMICMVLLGIAMALWMIFRSLQEHVKVADQVISELQAGNLKARFPIKKKDEIGNAMERFNGMADEIERLVERLRSAESSRNNLLQELAHDLRTPVASLQTIHESVFSAAKMEPDVAELADLARKEVDYLGHLVEDLLLLAQLSEPHYQPNKHPLDLVAVLEEEGDSLVLRKGGAIRLEKKFESEEALVRGDEHLFKRLVRNALENAFSYAKEKVEMKVWTSSGNRIHVRITDDGPGFEPSMLSKFGERRGQRMIKKSQGGRLSLGLGSVIMKSVITLHRGELQASNSPNGGAVIDFSIPFEGANF